MVCQTTNLQTFLHGQHSINFSLVGLIWSNSIYITLNFIFWYSVNSIFNAITEFIYVHCFHCHEVTKLLQWEDRASSGIHRRSWEMVCLPCIVLFSFSKPGTPKRLNDSLVFFFFNEIMIITRDSVIVKLAPEWHILSVLSHHDIMMYRFKIWILAALVPSASCAKLDSEAGVPVKSNSVLQTQHKVAIWMQAAVDRYMTIYIYIHIKIVHV